MSIIRFIVAAVSVAAVGLGHPVGAAAAEVLSPPTSAPVLDPFRLPEGPYGPGNRGIEYDTDDGDPVVAAGSGVVAFAGPVAGALFVSVEHPGGLRVTYGYVGRILVRPGTRVDRGDLVALAAGPFHFTTRLHGAYVDPASLFGEARTRVRLVPHRVEPIRPATLLDGP